MQYSFSAAALVALIPLAAAHGHLDSIVAGGKTYALAGPDWAYNKNIADAGWRQGNQDNGYVASDAATLAGKTIACHKGGKEDGVEFDAARPGKGEAVPVAAGSSVTLTWNTWPESHHGPLMNYLAKCPGKCNALKDATGLKFFKISQAGLTNPSAANNAGWATDDLLRNDLKTSVTIPSNIAPGEYVLRHELLALHSAGSTGGAQFYPICISINVSGSGTANPAGVAGSALYKATDPGVTISIYGKLNGYTIPGPAVIAGAARSFFKKFTA
ncbi:hypothetical protein CAC42_3725 [Sphaceloma murrayae]|uniref:Auxiliary Activity family 9 catalytic domain-containing protein n=1 Tax=Sphaceloma murrayae TaxID=2082308 RepID=A0A2K1QHQ7_9PEZI|nr:hypothetical protein CAC42_3725 [Sphaceloma murrayae]